MLVYQCVPLWFKLMPTVSSRSKNSSLLTYVSQVKSRTFKLPVIIFQSNWKSSSLKDGDEQVDQQDVGHQEVAGHEGGGERGTRYTGRKLLSVLVVQVVTTWSCWLSTSRNMQRFVQTVLHYVKYTHEHLFIVVTLHQLLCIRPVLYHIP
jgi:hypothetical protein